MFRLLGEHPDSVLPKVTTTPGFVSVRAKEASDPTKYGPNVYYTFVVPPAKTDAKEPGLLERLRKKFGRNKVAADDGMFASETPAFA